MSRRWIERLARRWTRRVRAYAGTRSVAVELLSARGTRRHGAARADIGAAPDGDRSAALLAALEEALRALQAQAGGSLRGLRCDLVLADAWVVYDVVAVDLARLKPALAQRAIAAALADVAGTDAEALVVSWQAQRGGAPFAMAIARALAQRLLAAVQEFGLAPASMTGELVAVFNAQRKRLGGRRAVLAVGRGDGAQIALLAAGAIAATRFELGRTGAGELARAAAGALRTRGEDSGAAIDYLLDADGGGDEDGPWRRVPPPAWTAG